MLVGSLATRRTFSTNDDWLLWIVSCWGTACLWAVGKKRECMGAKQKDDNPSPSLRERGKRAGSDTDADERIWHRISTYSTMPDNEIIGTDDLMLWVMLNLCVMLREHESTISCSRITETPQMASLGVPVCLAQAYPTHERSRYNIWKQLSCQWASQFWLIA